MSRWTLNALRDIDRVAGRLAEAGFSQRAAADKSARFAAAAATLIGEGVGAETVAAAFFVPGRIEVLGKHTDYAGGRSLIAAAERGFCGVAVLRDDRRVRLVDVGRDQQAEFSWTADLSPVQGDWANYPMTVCRRYALNFALPTHGASIAFSSDLPVAAGMSSSSALMVMTFLLLAESNDLTHDPAFQANIGSVEDLAGFLGTVENGQTFRSLVGDRGVGTFGGSEDHTAILCSRPGHWSQFSYCPVRHERLVAAPTGYLFAIGVCGIVAEKTGAAMDQYNRASRRAAAVARIWRDATGRDDPHLAAAVNSAGDAVERLRGYLGSLRHEEFHADDLLNRLDQFVAESNEIIPAVPDRLDQEGLRRFGSLAARSQDLGARLLGNQLPETVFLAAAAGRCGAVAASAFGAGFGGSVWALIDENRASDFVGRWAEAYAAAFPEAAARAEYFTTRAGPPATSIGSNSLLKILA